LNMEGTGSASGKRFSIGMHALLDQRLMFEIYKFR